MKVNKFRP